MYHTAEQRLGKLLQAGTTGLLDGRLIGLEKECLRVNQQGNISQLSHPAGLGAALTNPYITTDYSEALLELITPPLAGPRQALDFLRDTQHFVYGHLQDEFLWSTSMPCVVAGETSIPLARYGNSNAGTMKTVYRRGLGHRYGRVMQVIAGMHFNYSYSADFWRRYGELMGADGDDQAFINEQYFALIRNLLRFGWMIPYLFGASPAVCKSFLNGRSSRLDEFNENTFFEPYATSLRMGDIGYQNNKENETGIKVCYHDLDTYVSSLRYAIATPAQEYSHIGLVRDGVYQQLNCNLLQIENEYYSTVRPKQPPRGMEKPSTALHKRGVQYIELRSLDVNAFDPLGIDHDQLLFLEVFLLFCLVHDSPRLEYDDRECIDRNEMAAAHRGRDASLQLEWRGKGHSIRSWAGELCDAMQGAAQILDHASGGTEYSRILRQQTEIARDPDGTASARMLAEMRANKEGFFHFAQRKSREHQAYFEGMQLDAARRALFERTATESLAKQAEIEAGDTQSFTEFLEAYWTQE